MAIASTHSLLVEPPTNTLHNSVQQFPHSNSMCVIEGCQHSVECFVWWVDVYKHIMASKVHYIISLLMNIYAHTIIVSYKDCCSWRRNHVSIDASYIEGNAKGLCTLTKKVIDNGDVTTLLAVSTREDQRVASDGAIVYTTTWSLRSREG